MVDIKTVEKRVRTFLEEHRGRFFNAHELSRMVGERYPNDNLTPAEIKIASLNLVGSGKAELAIPEWTVGISERR